LGLKAVYRIFQVVILPSDQVLVAMMISVCPVLPQQSIPEIFVLRTTYE
jgi:hypothetical protein